MTHHDAECWLQVEPQFWNGSGALRSIKLVRAGQRRPTTQLAGTVLVMLTLRIEDEAFKPLRVADPVLVTSATTSAVAEVGDVHVGDLGLRDELLTRMVANVDKHGDAAS
jgi:hypothetical protein